jgi:hypothetical protein
MKKYKYKDKSYSSAPVSLVSAELPKKHKSKTVNRFNKDVNSSIKSLKCGDIIFSEVHSEIEDFTGTGASDLEILNRYNSIGLSRMEFQVFLAIFDIFISEYNKTKSIDTHIYLSLKDFHNKVLGIKNRIRDQDIQRYFNIFNNLTNKIITIDTSMVIKKKLKQAYFRSSITNITIISIPEEKFYGLRIYPTGYIEYECVNSKHISNYLPRDFIRLDMRENDNVLFFGYYLVRIHKINKRNCSLSFTWESNIIKIINNTLPSPDYFFENYNKNPRKTQLLKRSVIDPLKKSLDILKNYNYVIKFDIPNLTPKTLFKEQKVNIVFNYDKTKFKNSSDQIKI